MRATKAERSTVVSPLLLIVSGLLLFFGGCMAFSLGARPWALDAALIAVGFILLLRGYLPVARKREATEEALERGVAEERAALDKIPEAEMQFALQFEPKEDDRAPR